MKNSIRIFILSFVLDVVLLFVKKRRSKADRKFESQRKKTILLTGTFHSKNWINSHIIPMSQSAYCNRLILVASDPIEKVNNIEVITPPAWLKKIFGNVLSRLIMFIYCSYKLQPDYVGGFHLLFNGISAALASALFKMKSVYFCVGGPAEVLGGGIQSENKILKHLTEPNKKIERKLVEMTRHFDLIITMGTSAKDFFIRNCACGNVYVNSGGINGSIFYPKNTEKKYDMIIAGRLEDIKRIDIFIDAISMLKEEGVNVNAVVVGNGSLAENLKGQAEKLNLSNSILFVGAKQDMHEWYNSAKIFVLTSDSEGLSLALIEAMMCGLPAIVTDVGDLSDIVINGENGYLVDSRNPSEFAKRIRDIIQTYDNESYSKLSAKAIESAQAFELKSAVKKWDYIFSNSTSTLESESD
jgi:glycosyltransferase involved in cell wall biosynthesis